MVLSCLPSYFQENAGLLGMQRPMKERVGLKQVNIKTKIPISRDELFTRRSSDHHLKLHRVLIWLTLCDCLKVSFFSISLMFSLQDMCCEWWQWCCCISGPVKVGRVPVYALWLSLLWWFIERSNMMRHVCGYGTEQLACSSMHAQCRPNWSELCRNQEDGKKFAPSPVLILGYQVFK